MAKNKVAPRPTLNLFEQARSALDILREVPSALDAILDVAEHFVGRTQERVDTISDQLKRTFGPEGEDE